MESQRESAELDNQKIENAWLETLALFFFLLPFYCLTLSINPQPVQAGAGPNCLHVPFLM